MTRVGQKIAIPFVLAAALCLALPHAATAQSMSSCPELKSDVHKAIECIEGIFSEAPVHLTLSSVPPGNGFPIGIVYEDAVHHLGGAKSLTDSKLALVGSSNGSWSATGSLTWLPPLHYTDVSSDLGGCTHRLGVLCTSRVMSVQFYASHRNLKNLSFYGLGSSAPDTTYTFRETETYGGVVATLPLTTWLRVEGQAESRQPSLPAFSDPLSVAGHFTEATAPGLSAQPAFMHYASTVLTEAMHISEPLSSDDEDDTIGPLMKHRTVLRFNNDAGYHWHTDLDTGHYSFQQFLFSGDESFEFGSVIRRPGVSGLLAHLCEGVKKTSKCIFGTLDVKSLVTLSNVGSTRAMPFYFQPTVGGSDIESRQSLRGFDNYRFRGADAAMLQVEFGRTLKDPLGAFLFLDAGKVGASASDLSSSRMREDGGVGLSVRLQGKVVLQVFAAVGAGHGVHLGYNFEKLF